MAYEIVIGGSSMPFESVRAFGAWLASRTDPVIIAAAQDAAAMEVRGLGGQVNGQTILLYSGQTFNSADGKIDFRSTPRLVGSELVMGSPADARLFLVQSSPAGRYIGELGAGVGDAIDAGRVSTQYRSAESRIFGAFWEAASVSVAVEGGRQGALNAIIGELQPGRTHWDAVYSREIVSAFAGALSRADADGGPRSTFLFNGRVVQISDYLSAADQQSLRALANDSTFKATGTINATYLTDTVVRGLNDFMDRAAVTFRGDWIEAQSRMLTVPGSAGVGVEMNDIFAQARSSGQTLNDRVADVFRKATVTESALYGMVFDYRFGSTGSTIIPEYLANFVPDGVPPPEQRPGGFVLRGLSAGSIAAIGLLGPAFIAYDAYTSAAQAATAYGEGRTTDSAEIWARFAARLYVGWEGAVAGAAVGSPLGAAGSLFFGLLGGAIGTLAGDVAVSQIWRAVEAIDRYITVETPLIDNNDFGVTLLRSDLASRGITNASAQDRILYATLNSYTAARRTDPNLTFEAYVSRLITTIGTVHGDQLSDPAGDNLTAVFERNAFGELVTRIYTPAGDLASVTYQAFDPNGAPSIGPRIVTTSNGIVTTITSTSLPAGEPVPGVDPGLTLLRQLLALHGIMDETFVTQISDAVLDQWTAAKATQSGLSLEAFVGTILSTGVPDPQTTVKGQYDLRMATEETADGTLVIRTYDRHGEVVSEWSADSDDGFDLFDDEYLQFFNDDDSSLRWEWDTGDASPWSSQAISYNPLGHVVSTNLVNDDGTMEVTAFDAEGHQIWTSRTQLFDALGRQTHSNLLLDAGGKEETTFDTDSNQIWSRLVEIYNASGQHTEDTWYYDSGFRYRNVFDVNGDQIWTWYGEAYNPAGQHVEDQWFMDNGFRYRNVFDVNANQNWTWYGEAYNPAGQHVEDQWFMDNGWRHRNMFDVNSDQPWSWHAEAYNPSGQHVEDNWFHDDGWRYRNMFDVNNDQSWSWHAEFYNPSGQHTEDHWFQDNGWHHRNMFDVNNDQPWSWHAEAYNPIGQRVEDNWFHDDGWRYRNMFDVNNDQPWSWHAEFYSPSGQHTEDHWFQDNGWHHRNMFDVNNDQPWSWHAEAYDPSGQHVEDNWFHDSGWRSRNVFDVGNNQTWSWFGEQYDPSGRLVQRQEFGDNGGITTTTWDVDNTQPWSWITDYGLDTSQPIANGHRSGGNDNGTTFQTGYELHTAGVVYSTTRTYAATGQLLFTDEINTNGEGVLVHTDAARPGPAGTRIVTNANAVLSQAGMVQDWGSFASPGLNMPAVVAVPNLNVPTGTFTFTPPSTPLFTFDPGAIVLPPITVFANIGPYI